MMVGNCAYYIHSLWIDDEYKIWNIEYWLANFVCCIVCLCSISDGGVIQQSHAEALNRDQQNNYMILLQQREEENRQEIAKLTAEIKALKVQLLQHRSKFLERIILWYWFLVYFCHLLKKSYILFYVFFSRLKYRSLISKLLFFVFFLPKKKNIF